MLILHEEHNRDLFGYCLLHRAKYNKYPFVKVIKY